LYKFIIFQPTCQAVANAFANEIKVKTPANVVTELLSQLFTMVTIPFVLKCYFYSVQYLHVFQHNKFLRRRMFVLYIPANGLK